LLAEADFMARHNTSGTLSTDKLRRPDPRESQGLPALLYLARSKANGFEIAQMALDGDTVYDDWIAEARSRNGHGEHATEDEEQAP